MQVYIDKINNIVYKQMNNVSYYGQLQDFKPTYEDDFLPRKLQQRYKVNWKSGDSLGYEHEEFYTEVDKDEWQNYDNSDLKTIVEFYKRIQKMKDNADAE